MGPAVRKKASGKAESGPRTREHKPERGHATARPTPGSSLTVRLFRYASLVIASEIPLQELQAANGNPCCGAEISVRILAGLAPEPDRDEWVHHWQTGYGNIDISLARQRGRFLLRFPDLADFSIAADGSDVGVRASSECTPETLRHLILDQVLPRVLAHRGSLVLHAGAVDVGGRAVAFLGQSGVGKSTLVASFRNAGFPLLSDDGLVLTHSEAGVHVLPTYPSVRLWPETVTGLFANPPEVAPMAHYSSKQRLLVGAGTSVSGGELPLTACLVLTGDRNGEIEVSPVAPGAACMEIIRNAFQLDLADPERTAKLFQLAGAVANAVPVFALRYPRDLARLPEVRAAILRQTA